MDEREVIAGLKRRDPAAVEELVHKYSDRLLRSAFLLCGNEADAKDLVQEAYLQGLQSAHRFNGRSSAYTWMHAILLNLSRHHHRARKHLVPDDELTEHSTHAEDPIPFDTEFASSRLTEALGQLSAAHREVLVLRFYENMKLHEIAAHLALSRGTVKSRLHYAIAEMQKLLPAELNLFGTGGTNNMEKW